MVGWSRYLGTYVFADPRVPVLDRRTVSVLERTRGMDGAEDAAGCQVCGLVCRCIVWTVVVDAVDDERILSSSGRKAVGPVFWNVVLVLCLCHLL